MSGDQIPEIQFRSDFSVDLVDVSGDTNLTGDESVLRAMLISTLQDQALAAPGDQEGAKRDIGRIRFLMKNRHGTPFEHNMMTFRVEAPIFVFREWHRHRIGISINEQSGRYVELPPMFYVPPPERPLVQVGKPGAYEYVPGTADQYEALVAAMKEQATSQYDAYQSALNADIAKEVARMHLGVNIYSSMYWTCNARSLMAFLSLRVQKPPMFQTIDIGQKEPVQHRVEGGSMFPSKPMWEIDQCAQKMESFFAALFPITYQAFVDFGRVCP